MNYTVPEFEVERNINRCISCGACVRQCSYEVHYFDDDGKTVLADESKCVACHICAAICPTRAIKIKKYDMAYKEHSNWTPVMQKEINLQAATGGVLLSGMSNNKPYPIYWDKILLNASQVTNPSIDPLREPMEIRTFLGRKPEKLEYLKELLDTCLPTKIDDNIEGRLYSKLIINSCINSLAGITGKPLGQLVDDRTACNVFLEITREAMRTAKKMGMKVPKYGKLLEYRMLMLMDNAVYNFICTMVVKMVSKAKYKDVRPSTLQSLEAGQKTEIDIMNGLISQYGRENGVPTPINDKLTQMIKEIENGERKISMENLAEFKN